MTQLYNNTKIMNISQLYTYNTCILIKKIKSGSVQSEIRIYERSHISNLRNKYKLHIDNVRTNYGKKTIMFEGVQLFNKLPDEIKLCDSIKSFKTKLKNHIVSSL